MKASFPSNMEPWNEFAISVNNTEETMVLDGLSIIRHKKEVYGDFDMRLFGMFENKMDSFYNESDCACVVDILGDVEYDNYIDLVCGGGELCIDRRVYKPIAYLRKPNRFVSCRIHRYANRFILPGLNMIGIKDNRYVIIDNERFSAVTRRVAV